MNKAFIVLVLISLLLLSGCWHPKAKNLSEQEQCDLSCTSIDPDDFLTLDMCRQECKKRFMNLS